MNWLTTTFLPGLILAAVILNQIYPGEVFSTSKYFLLFITHGVFLILLFTRFSVDRSNSSNKLFLFLALLLCTILPGISASINLKRSEEMGWLLMAYFALFISIQWLKLSSKQLDWACCLIAHLGGVICLMALYQFFFGLNTLQKEIIRTQGMDPQFQAALLSRAASHRVFAFFPLPNTLAGFITIVIPLQVYFLAWTCPQKYLVQWRIPIDVTDTPPFLRHPGMRMVILGELLMSLIVLALTRSFGGWLCLLSLVLCACGAFFYHRPEVRKKTLSLLALFILIGILWLGWLSYSRGFTLWNLSHRENSIRLRWNNYRTALAIFGEFKWTGVGLNNYGSINPKYQPSVNNVTQYAHNTPLQLLAECGFPFLIISLFVSIGLSRRLIRTKRKLNGNSPCFSPFSFALGASLTAWIIHNLVDINFYFPSLGSLGILVLALWVKSGEPGSLSPVNKGQEIEQPSDGTLAPTMRNRLLHGIVTIAFILNSGLIFRGYLSNSCLELAVLHEGKKEYHQALQYADWGAKLRSYDPESQLIRSRNWIMINSNLITQKQILETLKTAYSRAISLDPYNANYHYELSRVLLRMGETDQSAMEKHRASTLFPAEPKYQ